MLKAVFYAKYFVSYNHTKKLGIKRGIRITFKCLDEKGSLYQGIATLLFSIQSCSQNTIYFARVNIAYIHCFLRYTNVSERKKIISVLLRQGTDVIGVFLSNCLTNSCRHIIHNPHNKSNHHHNQSYFIPFC